EPYPAGLARGRQVLEVRERRAGRCRRRRRPGLRRRGRWTLLQRLVDGLRFAGALIGVDVEVLVVLLEVRHRAADDRRAEVLVIDSDVLLLGESLDDMLLVFLDNVRVRPGKQRRGRGRRNGLRPSGRRGGGG